MRATHQRGAALIDIVFAAGLGAVLSAMAVPVLHGARQTYETRTTARYLANRLQHARIEALRRNAVVALRFDPDDTDRLGMYVDGDGDGVLEHDIARGIDVPIVPVHRLSDYAGPVGLRINQPVPEPESGIPLAAGSDPLRVGRSTLLSFSPLGSATSGTVYLAAARGPQLAIRILGATGRMRVLRFDRAGGQWRED